MPPFAPEAAAPAGKRGITHKRVQNRKMKMELGCCLRYPTFRQGYTAEIKRVAGRRDALIPICIVKIITDSRCTEYSKPGHPERPARILGTVEALKKAAAPSFVWAEPLAVSEISLLRAHSPHHLQRLEAPFEFDADTPTFPGIGAHARRSVGVSGALHALLQSARAGENGLQPDASSGPSRHRGIRRWAFAISTPSPSPRWKFLPCRRI